MTHKEIINREHPNLVQNWGESAQLLSFNQIMDLMDKAVDEYKIIGGNWFTKLFLKEPTHTKWTVYKENVDAVQTTRQALMFGDDVIKKENVIIDIYRRFERKTGLPEYKNIVKVS